MGYVNPFSQIQGLSPERIDQGVDFAGSGNVLAIGNGTVLETGGGGWPGGPYMTYRLNDGPDAGKIVYVAENIHPLVQVGQNVTAGQAIASMFQGGTGIETGWANPPGGQSPLSQSPAAGSISGANLPAGGTAVGHDFENLLVSLGVPKAPNFGATAGGTDPAGYGGNAPAPTGGPTGSGGINATPTAALKWYDLFGPVSFLAGLPKDISGQASTIGDIGQGIYDLVKEIGHIGSWFSWLFAPSHWLRIGAFIAGLLTMLGGIWFLSKAMNVNPGIGGMPVPIPV